jgi:O-antigen/teichoic acid export membrane protein
MRKLRTEAIITFLIKISSILLGLALNIFLARVLDVEKFGIFVYAISATRLLGFAGNVGLNKLLVREVAIYDAKEKWYAIHSILKWSDILVIVVSVTLTAIAVIVSRLFAVEHLDQSKELLMGLSLCLITLPVFSLNSLRSAALKGFHYVHSALLPEFIVYPLLTLLICIFLFIIDRNLLTVNNAIIANIVSSFFMLFISNFFLGKHLHTISKEDGKIEYWHREWLSSALPLMMVNAAQIILVRVDTLLLGSISGPVDAGIYVVLAYGVQLISFIRVSANMVLEPTIARIYAEDGISQRLQTLVKKSALQVFVVACIGSLFVFVFSPIWLSWFGEEFQTGKIALLFLTIGEIIHASASPSWKLLVATGHEKFTAISVTISAILNTILNFYLIPRYSMNGAAFATMISILVNNIMMTWWARYKIRIKTTVFGF